MRLPRWTHKLYANLFGYFWLPCPICGEYFGGHEIRKFPVAHIITKIEPGLIHGEVVCNNQYCHEKADRINKEKYNDLGR